MIIGVNGYGDSGKDSFFLGVEPLGYQRRAFADPLKQMCADLLGVPVHYWHDRKLKSQPLTEFGYPDLTPDQVAIKMGTEVGRHIHKDVWVRKAVRDLQSEDSIVFTDCRFPNEAQAIKNLGGVIVRVNRPGVGPRIDKSTGSPHLSDVVLDDWAFDFIIENDASLSEFYSRCMYVERVAARRR